MLTVPPNFISSIVVAIETVVVVVVVEAVVEAVLESVLLLNNLSIESMSVLTF